MRRQPYALLISLSTVVTGWNLAACSHDRIDEGLNSPKPAPSISTPTDPIQHNYPDCGDGPPPCVTWDEHAWHLVHGYEPHRTTILVQCRAEDGGPVLPCVWKQQTPDSKWIVFTKE